MSSGKQALMDEIEAAAALVAALRKIEDRGRNVVTRLLDGAPFVEFEHYPEDDAIDPGSHAQYYLHAHRRGESAHIHCFMRTAGLAPGMQALGTSAEPGQTRGMTHIAAVSLDGFGRPVGFFTTNRWVTGDEWFAAEDLIRLLPRMTWGDASGPAPVNRALSALFVLYRRTIEALIRRRDHKIAAWIAHHPGRDVFEDRRLEILSTATLDIEKTLARLRARLDE